MAIRSVVTRGFGNGTFNGTIALVARRGFGAAAEEELSAIGDGWVLDHGSGGWLLFDQDNEWVLDHQSDGWSIYD